MPQPSALTDSTGRTADDVIENVADVAAHTPVNILATEIDDTPDAASVNTKINAMGTEIEANVNARLAAVEDSLADLAAKINSNSAGFGQVAADLTANDPATNGS